MFYASRVSVSGSNTSKLDKNVLRLIFSRLPLIADKFAESGSELSFIFF